MYSDKTLIAFLNGELDDKLSQAIEADMTADRSLERRIMDLDPMAATVRAGMQSLPQSGRLDPIQKQFKAPTEKSFKSGGLIAATLAVGLGIGWVVSSFLQNNTTNWRTEVAQYQSLYVNETIAHLDVSPAELSKQFERASQALGLSLPQDALSNIDGLELRRAQVLGIAGAPLVQIVYRDSNGTPYALCVTTGTNAAVGSEELYNMASHSWANGTHQFLLIGGRDQDLVDNLASDMSAKI